MDLLHISVGAAVSSMKQHVTGILQDSNGRAKVSPSDKRKVSLLGGDSLYATAQWAMANIDSRPCRQLIADTIAKYSDGQLRKREVQWNCDLTIREYLEVQKPGGAAAFLSAATACAGLVNGVDSAIADELAAFGADIGLVVGLLKDTRGEGIRNALRAGNISAPVIFSLETDPRLRSILERRLERPGDFEEAYRRVQQAGTAPTIRLINRLGLRACVRLECLEEGPEKATLVTLARGIACLPSSDDCPTKEPLVPAKAEVIQGQARGFDMSEPQTR